MSLEIRPRGIDPATLRARLKFLDKFEAQLARQIQWQECESPEEYRKMRREGLNGFTAPVKNPKRRIVNLRGRDGQQIELRIIDPENQKAKGVWLHFHAGGFIIGSNASYDSYLTNLANRLGLSMVSVEYRLAPENSFPACLHDCVDAALYTLSSVGEKVLGAPLRILGGESAGGWLAVSTGLALRRDHNVDCRSKLAAIVASYGIFDLTYTPSLLEHERNLVLSRQGMMDFVDAAFGNVPMADRKKALISPLYADLHEMPPALFLTGNIEPLLDDSIFMAVRWQQAGNTTALKVVDGACHAFTIIDMGETTVEGIDLLSDFVQDRLSPIANSD